MNDLKKLFCFVVCLCWVFATIGGFGYLLYYGVPQFAVANLGLSAMAFPYAKDAWDYLLS